MSQSSEYTIRTFPEEPLRGYVEGYYGRLLNWGERDQIVETLHSLKMNVWFYAPKEDPCHRLKWRNARDELWMSDFSRFCSRSQSKGVYVIAGLAPGLDFNFSALDERSIDAADLAVGSVEITAVRNSASNTDYTILLEKARALLGAGADFIGLLMDDIDPDFKERSGGFDSEGHAHAVLANRLGFDLNICVLVVPRIYANELVVEDPRYLPDLTDALDLRHAISHCGDNVVSISIKPEDCASHLGDQGHRVIVWDNLYANDYCPRRLFVGEWRGRDRLRDVLLNPTGMPCTDQLLLELMALHKGASICVDFVPVDSDADRTVVANFDGVLQNVGDGQESLIAAAQGSAEWRALMDKHGVPKEFDLVADYCWHPFCNGDAWQPVEPQAITVAAIEAALDELLWRWKTPLGLEWYPYLMGLRQDLILRSGHLPALRVMKTQTSALASQLLDSS